MAGCERAWLGVRGRGRLGGSVAGCEGAWQGEGAWQAVREHGRV